MFAQSVCSGERCAASGGEAGSARAATLLILAPPASNFYKDSPSVARLVLRKKADTLPARVCWNKTQRRMLQVVTLVQMICPLLEVEQRREQTGCSDWSAQWAEPLMKRDLDLGTHLSKGLNFGRGCIIPWCYSVGMVRPIWDVCFSVWEVRGGDADGRDRWASVVLRKSMCRPKVGLVVNHFKSTKSEQGCAKSELHQKVMSERFSPRNSIFRE